MSIIRIRTCIYKMSMAEGSCSDWSVIQVIQVRAFICLKGEGRDWKLPKKEVALFKDCSGNDSVSALKERQIDQEIV